MSDSDQPVNPTSFSSSNNSSTSEDENMFHMDDVPLNPNQLPVYDSPLHHLPIDEAEEVPVQGQIPLPVAPIPVEQPQQPVTLNPPHLIDAAAEEAAIDVPNGAAVEIPVEEEPLDPNPPHLIVAAAEEAAIDAVAADIKDPEADLKAVNDANITEDSEAEMIKRLDANVVVEGRRKRRRTTKSVQEMEISTCFEIKEEERRSMEVIAWEKLRASIVSYNGKVIGTKSASDSKQVKLLKYLKD